MLIGYNMGESQINYKQVSFEPHTCFILNKHWEISYMNSRFPFLLRNPMFWQPRAHIPPGGVVIENQSPTAGLWDVDPALLSSSQPPWARYLAPVPPFLYVTDSGTDDTCLLEFFFI